MPGPLTHGSALAVAGGARDREAYFVAAYGLLADGGCEAVTVTALCQRMHATTGSFYHHFADMPAFVAALADRWQQGRLAWIADCAAVADPLRRYELIVNQTMEFLVTPGESAVRAWAHTEPAWAVALFAMHQAIDDMTVRTLDELVGDPDLARLLQRQAVCAATGMTLRAEGTLDATRFLRLASELGRRTIGVETELVEIDGHLQFRFLDGREPDLPADPPWSSPDLHGLAWVDADPEPSGAAPGPEVRDRSRADYFRAARELLAQLGSDGVTIDALCSRLGVTKGSFRWHFGGMPAFVEALAADWEQAHEAGLAALAQEPDSRTRLDALFRQMLRAPDPVHVAIRAWAHTEPMIGRALHQIDDRRQAVFTTAIRETTSDPAADLLAEAMLWLAIGLHQPVPGVDPETAARIVLVFARRYLRIGAELRVADNQPVLKVRRPM